MYSIVCFERFFFPVKAETLDFYMNSLKHCMLATNLKKKKPKHYMGQPRHACELPIYDFSCMPLPHSPGWFVFSCHEIRSDTDLSLFTRPRQPDFTSRPICGDRQVLFLVTCGAFCCLKPEELKGWQLSQMCHWHTGEIWAISWRCQVCTTVS